MGLTVTILAYHEAENLKWLLPELKRIITPLETGDVEYLVVDSAKPTDDTEAVCREFGARYINQEEPGYGGAYRTAIKYAYYDYFLILDADGSQDYTKIPEMYNVMIAGADVVIGSRYITGGKTDDAKSSQIMSKILNAAFRTGIGVNVHDFSNSLRIYHTADLKKLHLTSVNFDMSEEIILKLKLMKNNSIIIREVPISFKKREIGESKRSLMTFIICFGKMLVYSLVLRAVSGKHYKSEIHDNRASRITNSIFFGIVGAIAAAINTLFFVMFNKSVQFIAANCLAWVISIPFGFVISKTILYNNWKWSWRILKNQFQHFIVRTLITGAVDMMVLWIMIDFLAGSHTVSKIVSCIVAIILNYIIFVLTGFNKITREGQQ